MLADRTKVDVPRPVRIALIVAMAENRVIGRAGQLPWRMPSDLKLFQRLTMGKPVIMGRKTFLSIGRPLPGRHNIVVTGDTLFAPAGVQVARSLEDAFDAGRAAAVAMAADEIMVIGGGEIYRAAVARADRVYLTIVHACPDGDTHFPDLDPAWVEVAREPVATGDGDDHRATLLIMDRGGSIRATP